MGLKNTYQAKKRFTKVPVSKTGMWYQDRDVVVPSNQITMKGPQGQLDYFDSPIMGTGMQSGQTQVMQPGREYSFPNDNSVYETKMQGGGISGNSELALDFASMIPGPVGMVASGLGLFNDLYQGDWVGAGLNTANILTGGTSKGLMSVARLASNAGARNAANLLASGSRNLNRTSRVINNYTKPIDTSRNILRTPNYSTERGGYQDNTRVAPVVRPDWYNSQQWDKAMRSQMQNGGLFPVGPYDEMMAPKQGNYLQPDINRPYYIDDFGGMRSEYKMGFNDNGKETLIPTVVQGRQLTEDQAIDNYFRTGLNMGKYNSVGDAEYASKMRTAKYNMFQDPVRFQMQIGGEKSTEQNPVRMNPVNISAKRRNQDYRTYQDNTVNNNQIVPSEFRGRRYVQPTLSEYVEPSIGNRILNTLASPMTALSNNRIGSRNPYDYALDVVNPFSWIQSGERAVGSLSEGQYGDAALNALGALPVLGVADDAGRALSKAGNYATTQTPLKNAYKYNPLAFKANSKAYYRVLGKEGLDDAFESGVIRASQKNVDEISGEPFYDRPYFSKSVPLDRDFKSPLKKKGKQSTGSPYPDDTMVEVFGDSRFYPSSNLVTSPINTLTPFDEGVNFYKRDWLQGYKKVNPPKPQKQNGGLQQSYKKTKRFK